MPAPDNSGDIRKVEETTPEKVDQTAEKAGQAGVEDAYSGNGSDFQKVDEQRNQLTATDQEVLKDVEITGMTPEAKPLNQNDSTYDEGRVGRETEGLVLSNKDKAKLAEAGSADVDPRDAVRKTGNTADITAAEAGTTRLGLGDGQTAADGLKDITRSVEAGETVRAPRTGNQADALPGQDRNALAESWEQGSDRAATGPEVPAEVAAQPKAPTLDTGVESIKVAEVDDRRSIYITNFQAKDGVYNPAAAPGIGEHAVGESVESSIFSVPSFDTQSQDRAVTSDVRPDGVTYGYDGKISTGIFSSTEFQGSENLDANGRLVDRTIKYGSEADRANGTNTGIDITFDTGNGEKQTINGVDKVVTTYDAQSQQYETKIHTVDGKDFIALTDSTGEVKDFRELKQFDQAAVAQPPVGNAEANMLATDIERQEKGAADTTYENEAGDKVTNTVFDDGGVLTHTEVNGASRLTEVTDAAGRNTKLGWSEDGSQIKTLTTAEGTWTRSEENPNEWTNEAGEKRQFDVKVTNSETGELTYTTADTRTTWKSDGESIREQFATRDTVPAKFVDGNRVQEKYVKFQVENDKYGVAKKVIDERGTVYTPGSNGANKLEIDPETGAAKIKDFIGNETTFNLDGSRSEKSWTGARSEYDQNGKLTQMYNAEGELTSSYHYSRDPETGRYEVDQISNSSGLWEKTGQKENGRDVWVQNNGEDNVEENKIVGDVTINPQTGDMSITTDNPELKTVQTEVRKTDGTRIISDSDGNVEVRNADGTVAHKTEVQYQKEYELNDDGSYKRNEAGEYIPRTDGDGNPIYRLDENGKRIKTGREIVTTSIGQFEVNRSAEGGSTSYRDLTKNEDGTFKNPAIIKGEISIDKYGDLTITDETNGTRSEVYLDGTSYTQFSDDSFVFRDEKGNITDTVNKYGDTNAFQYDKDGKLVGFTSDNVHWTSKDGENWENDEGGDAKFRVDVKDNGDVHIHDDATNTTTIDRMSDGTRSIVRDDGSQSVFKDGKLVASQDINGNRFEYTYDGNGLASIKGPDGLIVRQGAKVEGSENATVARKLKVSDTGDISYQLMEQQENSNKLQPGDFVTQSSDGTKAYWDSDPNQSYGVPNRIERTVPDGNGGTQKLDLVLGEDGKYSSADGSKTYDSVWYDRFNGSLDLKDSEGNKSRFERDGSYTMEYKSGVSKSFDTGGRMTQMVDAKGQKYTFKYEGDETVPIEVQNSEGKWKRSLEPVGQVDGNDIYNWNNVDTGYNFRGEVSTENGEYSWKDESGIETTQLAEGGKIHKYKDGSQATEDADGRITSWTNPASGKEFNVDYSGDSPVVTMTRDGKTEVVEGVTNIATTPQGLELQITGADGVPEYVLQHTNGAEITSNAFGEITSYKSKEGAELSKEAGTADGRDIEHIMLDKEGKAIVELSDGAKRLYNDDGSSLTFEADGKTVRTLSADSNTEFVYELNKAQQDQVKKALETNDLDSISIRNPEKISEINRTTGETTEWTRGVDEFGDAVWSSPGETFKGNVSLDVKTGNSTWHRLDANGFTESVVNRNNKGQVNFVTDKQGVTTMFTYDQNGRTDSIMRSNFGWDSYQYRGEDGKWRNPLDVANPLNWGQDTGKAFDHKVLSNGDQVITPTQSVTDVLAGKPKTSTTVKADGTRITDNGDGSESVHYSSGSVAETHTHKAGADGEATKVKVLTDGSVELTGANGVIIRQNANSDMVTSIDADGNETQFRGKVTVGDNGSVTVLNEENNTQRMYLADGREASVGREVELSYTDGTKLTQGPDTNGLKFSRDGKELVLDGDIDIDRNGNPVVKLNNPSDYQKLEEFFGEDKASMPVTRQIKFDDGSSLAQGTRDGELIYTDQDGHKSTVKGSLSFDGEGNATTTLSSDSNNQELLDKIESGGSTELKFDTNGSFTDVSYKAIDSVAIKQNNGPGSVTQPVVQYTNGSKFSQNPETGQLEYTNKDGQVTTLDGKIEIDERGNAKVKLNSQENLTDEIRETLNREGPGESAVGVSLDADGTRLINHPTEEGKIVHISADGTETVIDGNIKLNADGTSQVNLSSPENVSADILSSIKGSGTASSTYNNVDLSKISAPQTGTQNRAGGPDAKSDEGGIFSGIEDVPAEPAAPSAPPYIPPDVPSTPTVPGREPDRLEVGGDDVVVPTREPVTDGAGNPLLDGHDDSGFARDATPGHVDTGERLETVRETAAEGAAERREVRQQEINERFEENRRIQEEQRIRQEEVARRNELINENKELQRALENHDGSDASIRATQEAAERARVEADQQVKEERERYQQELQQRQERLEQDRAREEERRKEEEQRIEEQEKRIKEEKERYEKEIEKAEKEKQEEIKRLHEERLEREERELKQRQDELERIKTRQTEIDKQIEGNQAKLDAIDAIEKSESASVPGESRVTGGETSEGNGKFREVTEIDPDTGNTVTKLVPAEGNTNGDISGVDNSALVKHLNDNPGGNSQLEEAIKSGEVKLVQALENGDTRMVEAIVNNDGKLEVALESGNVPLAEALEKGQIHVAKEIESGGNLQVVNAIKGNNFELASAIKSGDTVKVEAINRGIETAEVAKDLGGDHQGTFDASPDHSDAAPIGAPEDKVAADGGAVNLERTTAADAPAVESGSVDKAINSGELKVEPVNSKDTANVEATREAVKSGESAIVRELEDGSHQAVKTTIDNEGNVRVEIDGKDMPLESAAASHNLKAVTGSPEALRKLGDTTGALAQDDREQAGAAVSVSQDGTVIKATPIAEVSQPVNSDLGRSVVTESGEGKVQTSTKPVAEGQPVKVTEGGQGEVTVEVDADGNTKVTPAKNGAGAGTANGQNDPQGGTAQKDSKDGVAVNNADPDQGGTPIANADQKGSGPDPATATGVDPDPAATNGKQPAQTVKKENEAEVVDRNIDNAQDGAVTASETGKVVESPTKVVEAPADAGKGEAATHARSENGAQVDGKPAKPVENPTGKTPGKPVEGKVAEDGEQSGADPQSGTKAGQNAGQGADPKAPTSGPASNKDEQTNAPKGNGDPDASKATNNNDDEGGAPVVNNGDPDKGKTPVAKNDPDQNGQTQAPNENTTKTEDKPATKVEEAAASHDGAKAETTPVKVADGQTPPKAEGENLSRTETKPTDGKTVETKPVPTTQTPAKADGNGKVEETGDADTTKQDNKTGAGAGAGSANGQPKADPQNQNQDKNGAVQQEGGNQDKGGTPTGQNEDNGGQPANQEDKGTVKADPKGSTGDPDQGQTNPPTTNKDQPAEQQQPAKDKTGADTTAGDKPAGQTDASVAAGAHEAAKPDAQQPAKPVEGQPANQTPAGDNLSRTETGKTAEAKPTPQNPNGKVESAPKSEQPSDGTATKEDNKGGTTSGSASGNDPDPNKTTTQPGGEDKSTGTGSGQTTQTDPKAGNTEDKGSGQTTQPDPKAGTTEDKGSGQTTQTDPKAGTTEDNGSGQTTQTDPKAETPAAPSGETKGESKPVESADKSPVDNGAGATQGQDASKADTQQQPGKPAETLPANPTNSGDNLSRSETGKTSEAKPAPQNPTGKVESQPKADQSAETGTTKKDGTAGGSGTTTGNADPNNTTGQTPGGKEDNQGQSGKSGDPQQTGGTNTQGKDQDSGSTTGAGSAQKEDGTAAPTTGNASGTEPAAGNGNGTTADNKDQQSNNNNNSTTNGSGDATKPSTPADSGQTGSGQQTVPSVPTSSQDGSQAQTQPQTQSPTTAPVPDANLSKTTTSSTASGSDTVVTSTTKVTPVQTTESDTSKSQGQSAGTVPGTTSNGAAGTASTSGTSSATPQSGASTATSPQTADPNQGTPATTTSSTTTAKESSTGATSTTSSATTASNTDNGGATTSSTTSSNATTSSTTSTGDDGSSSAASSSTGTSSNTTTSTTTNSTADDNNTSASSTAGTTSNTTTTTTNSTADDNNTSATSTTSTSVDNSSYNSDSDTSTTRSTSKTYSDNYDTAVDISIGAVSRSLDSSTSDDTSDQSAASVAAAASVNSSGSQTSHSQGTVQTHQVQSNAGQSHTLNQASVTTSPTTHTATGQTQATSTQHISSVNQAGQTAASQTGQSQTTSTSNTGHAAGQGTGQAPGGQGTGQQPTVTSHNGVQITSSGTVGSGHISGTVSVGTTSQASGITVALTPGNGLALNATTHIAPGVSIGVSVNSHGATTAHPVATTTTTTTTSSGKATPATTTSTNVTLVTTTNATSTSGTGLTVSTTGTPITTATSTTSSAGSSGSGQGTGKAQGTGTGTATGTAGTNGTLPGTGTGANATNVTTTATGTTSADPSATSATNTTGQATNADPSATGTAQTSTATTTNAQSQTTAVVTLPNGVSVQIQPGSNSGTASNVNVSGTSDSQQTDSSISVTTTQAQDGSPVGAAIASGIATGANGGSIAEGALTGAFAGAQSSGAEGAIIGAISGAIGAAIGNELDGGIRFGESTDSASGLIGSNGQGITLSTNTGSTAANLDILSVQVDQSTGLDASDAVVDQTQDAQTDLDSSIDAGSDVEPDITVDIPSVLPTTLTLTDGSSFIIPEDWTTLRAGEDNILVLDNDGAVRYIVDNQGNVVGSEVGTDAQVIDFTPEENQNESTGSTGTGSDTASPSGSSPTASAGSNPLANGINAASGADSAGEGAIAGAINGALTGNGVEDVIAGAIGGAITGAVNDANSASDTPEAGTGIGIGIGTNVDSSDNVVVSEPTQTPSQAGNITSSPAVSTPSSSSTSFSTGTNNDSGFNPITTGLQVGSNSDNTGEGALNGALSGLAGGGGIEDAIIGAAAGAIGSAISGNDSGNFSGNAGNDSFVSTMPPPIDAGAFEPVPSLPVDDGAIFDSATISPSVPTNSGISGISNDPSGLNTQVPLSDPGSPVVSDSSSIPAAPTTNPSADLAGLPHDPVSGLPYDPSTGQIFDPGSGQPIGNIHNNPVDPANLDPISGSGSTTSQANPVAGKPIDPTTNLPYDPDSNLLLDPNTGKPIGTVPSGSNGQSANPDPVAGKPIDPTTGMPYDPDTGKLLDPSTGQPVGNVPAQSNQSGQGSNPGSDSGNTGDGTNITESERDGDRRTRVDNTQRVPANQTNSGKPEYGTSDSDHVRSEYDNGMQVETDRPENLADVVADELAKIHQAIESRLQELHSGDSDYNPADDWSGVAHGDIASRQDIIDMEAAEQDRIDREIEQDKIQDKLDQEDKRREEEEERLKQRKEEIKKLTDTMMTVLATRRRAELERIRKLLEQQRKVEEFIAKDTRRSKYQVRKGDSLEAIAKRNFKDIRIAKLIAEINKGKVVVITSDGKSSYDVKPGIVLTLPSPREAREWIMRRKHLSVVDAGFTPQNRPLSQEEKTKIENKKANVESLLGSLGLSLDPNHEIKYIVRLGDSLRSIAMKHPHLNDITLWRLLAEKNEIAVDTDSRGVPIADIARGTTLVLPTRDEINEFRRANGALVHPSSSKFSSKEVATSVRFGKDCSHCDATVPAGVSMCPSCGHVFDSKTSITGLKSIFSAVSKERKGVKTKDYKVLPSLEETLGVKTEQDPLAPSASDNGVDTTAEPDETPVVKPGSGVKTEQDILAPTPRAIASQETVDLDVESVKAQYAEEASLSATLIQSITTLHNRSEKAELKEVVSEETEVKNFINKLGESARVVHSESGNDKNRMQLEVRKENEWVQVMAYELSPSKSVRIEYSIKGKKPKQIKMDLPASAMQEMARNDLSNNWEEYCKKFLAGKKITA